MSLTRTPHQSIYLGEDLRRFILTLAMQQDRSESYVVRQLLKEAIDARTRARHDSQDYPAQ